jgi:MEKHLA domain
MASVLKKYRLQLYPAGCDKAVMLGPQLDIPDPENDWHTGHVAGLLNAFARVTGRDLAAEMKLDPARLGQSAWEGDFALLSHRGDRQAMLNYGNRFALELWECDWAAFTALPSAATAPRDDVPERAAMMAAAASHGFVSNYSGRRVSAKGKLFRIENGTIWRLVDANGEPFGMAATFRDFTPL